MTFTNKINYCSAYFLKNIDFFVDVLLLIKKGGLILINYLNFLFLVILLILVPGPDYILITKNTLSSKKIAGFQTIFGTCTALVIHTFFATIGLSALLVKSAFLFSIAKYLGAIYLIYLGVKSLLTKSSDAKSTKNNELSNPFLQGLLTNLLNPKVAIFFLTFLPQFVVHSNTSWFYFFLLGMTYAVATFILFGLYVVFLDKIRTIIESDKAKNLINKVSGIVLLLFGLKLFLEKK